MCEKRRADFNWVIWLVYFGRKILVGTSNKAWKGEKRAQGIQKKVNRGTQSEETRPRNPKKGK